MKIKEVCAQHNISMQTYYGWKRKYEVLVDGVRQARGRREKNARLKRIVADQAVQIDILNAINSKKW